MSKLLGSLAVGSKVEVDVLPAFQSRFGPSIVFQVADKDHAGYPANSTTLIAEKIIQIMGFDAKEPSNPNADRKNYGNSNYGHSNLLQWLNSDAAAGSWYTAQHQYDQAPTTKTTHVSYNPYTAWAGFLAMLEPQFGDLILDTTQTVALNTVTDGGGSETVTSKIFLASTTEVGLANENNIAEGSKLALFSNNASRVAYPTQPCYDNRDGLSDSSFATSKGWYWWLRTPHSSSARYVRRVGADGSRGYVSAYFGYFGVRPLCNLESAILVSDAPNAAGNYEIIYNQPPIISGTDTNLGTKGDAFTHQFSVTDPEGDKVDVEIRVDGRLIDAMANVTLGATLIAKVEGIEWFRLLNDTHTMEIIATDEKGSSTTRTLAFTKLVKYNEFYIVPPLPSDDRPTIAKILAAYEIPILSTLTVKISNNPFDQNPVWEDCTASIYADINHVFANMTSSGAEEGFGLHVRLDRGDAPMEEPCWLESIGGSYDDD